MRWERSESNRLETASDALPFITHQKACHSPTFPCCQLLHHRHGIGTDTTRLGSPVVWLPLPPLRSPFIIGLTLSETAPFAILSLTFQGTARLELATYGVVAVCVPCASAPVPSSPSHYLCYVPVCPSAPYTSRLTINWNFVGS